MTEQEAINLIKLTIPEGNNAMYIQLKEALKMAITALEKQIPKKPIYNDFEEDCDGEMFPCETLCPTCGYEFDFITWEDDEDYYCVCGQRIDWSKDAE